VGFPLRTPSDPRSEERANSILIPWADSGHPGGGERRVPRLRPVWDNRWGKRGVEDRWDDSVWCNCPSRSRSRSRRRATSRSPLDASRPRRGCARRAKLKGHLMGGNGWCPQISPEFRDAATIPPDDLLSSKISRGSGVVCAVPEDPGPDPSSPPRRGRAWEPFPQDRASGGSRPASRSRRRAPRPT
jgi:hypothetical protein